jgi:hypothetical protein
MQLSATFEAVIVIYGLHSRIEGKTGLSLGLMGDEFKLRFNTSHARPHPRTTYHLRRGTTLGQSTLLLPQHIRN